jgi:hypothetical protein
LTFELFHGIINYKQKKSEVNTMYANTNFKTKKALKEAVAGGAKIGIHAPGLGTPKINGVEYLEGPWYPKPHTWYAEVTMENGIIKKVK